MKKYIAYFDYLGYKQFILNNTSEHLNKRAEHILRDMEMALGQGKFLPPKNGVIVSDISETLINCLNVSDTIIFWSNDDSIESLEALLNVAKKFNWQEIFYNMPVRGIIVCDELEILSNKYSNQFGSIYSPNLIYGKGLVGAHLKCENLNWAGCVIDESVLRKIGETENISEFLDPFAKLYEIPYKKRMGDPKPEYALKIISGILNEVSFEQYKKNIYDSFSSDNKPIDLPRVQELLKNTIEYLETFRVLTK